MDSSRAEDGWGDDKVIDSCSLFGVMNVKRERFSSRDPVRAISNMHDRGNGLGGGFAIYGLYPEYEDAYALHIMYLCRDAKEKTERLVEERFRVLLDEELPRREAQVRNPPIIWRYFVEPKNFKVQEQRQTADDYVVDNVMRINTKTSKAFVFSSGKNMGIFKGVGFPEDIAEYFCLEEYKGHMWICHGRFPTNTPSWWGGAQPFGIIDWAVAHNGELSSYGVNRRYLETYGYKCTMQTDTEVLAYAFDLLVRRHRIPVEFVAKILTPPFWFEIDGMDPAQRHVLTALRHTYGSLLMNGPFSTIVGHQGEMIGLTDRIKLRPLTAGVKGDFFYLSSEEAAIHVISPNLDKVWNPDGGELVISRLESPIVLEIPAITTHTGRM